MAKKSSLKLKQPQKAVVICEGTYSTFGFDSKIQAEAHLKERGFHRTGADENRWSKDNIYVRVKEVNEPKPP
ncbi:MAG: hypothetical protein ABSF55_01230, partial [Candidatus Staskawiczbacteria bacterium]